MGKEDDATQDRVWRDIVENFGDRAELSPAELEPSDLADGRDGATPTQFTPFEQARYDGGPTSGFLDALDAMDALDEEPGHFSPEIEDAPPIPARRKAAWTAVLGAPAVLIVWVIVRDFVPFRMPGLVMGALVVVFLAAFAYLVGTMPKDRDDPFDDGARL